MQTKKKRMARADLRKWMVRILAAFCALLIAGSALAMAFL